MWNWLLHLVLVATVAGCPLCCQLGSIIATVPASVNSAGGCCPHCRVQRGADAPAHRQSPADDAPLHDDGLCQCFCGGGLMARPTQVSADDSQTLDFAHDATACPAAAIRDFAAAQLCYPPIAPVAFSGRDICRHLARWLC